MTIEKATYSYSKVYQACELVKTLNIDCKRKAEHFSIASQIKETTEKCYNLTGCLLFDYEWNYTAQDYFKAAWVSQSVLTPKSLARAIPICVFPLPAGDCKIP